MQWEPSGVNMIARDDCETIKRRHAEHLAYYKATDADCDIVAIGPVPQWDKQFAGGTQYRLQVKSYLGWRVYMLHTGCFASMPAWEEQPPCA